MLPSEDEMMFCILDESGNIFRGGGGLAIAREEIDAWEIALGTLVRGFDTSHLRNSVGKELCLRARKCAIMVINP